MSADDHGALLRDSIRSFLSRHGARSRVRALRGTQPGYDRAHWNELAALGCIGALAPVAHGGVGLSLADMAAMLQELAPGLGPEPVVPVAVGAVGLLSLAPDSTLSQSLLPDIASGELIAALAWQEEGYELPGAYKTTLSITGNQARLTGRKRFVVPACADGYLVTASSAEGPVICWVPAGEAGVALRSEGRIDGTSSAEVEFKDVVVSPAHRASGPTVTTEAICDVADRCNVAVAAELLGVAESMLRMTLEY
ncbi:MAG: acyl-CoA dehydrogenase family protein, partial [Usitatibacter sp.]